MKGQEWTRYTRATFVRNVAETEKAEHAGSDVPAMWADDREYQRAAQQARRDGVQVSKKKDPYGPEKCKGCNGTGKVAGRTCPSCMGTGVQ